jgi:hypothetical protein
VFLKKLESLVRIKDVELSCAMIIVDFSIAFFFILKNGLKNNMTSKLVAVNLKINSKNVKDLL